MKKLVIIFALVLFAGYLPAEQRLMPVVSASSKDWNPQSFWYYPWGRSGVHKGIDIFAQKGQPVVAPTQGLVLYAGHYGDGGKVVYLLGPKWRFHYFAHLQSINVKAFNALEAGEVIGAVGDSGNAKGKPPHLHYSIKSLLPHFQPDTENRNIHKALWQRLFYLNPGVWLTGADIKEKSP